MYVHNWKSLAKTQIRLSESSSSSQFRIQVWESKNSCSWSYLSSISCHCSANTPPMNKVGIKINENVSILDPINKSSYCENLKKKNILRGVNFYEYPRFTAIIINFVNSNFTKIFLVVIFISFFGLSLFDSITRQSFSNLHDFFCLDDRQHERKKIDNNKNISKYFFMRHLIYK